MKRIRILLQLVLFSFIFTPLFASADYSIFTNPSYGSSQWGLVSITGVQYFAQAFTTDSSSAQSLTSLTTALGPDTENSGTITFDIYNTSGLAPSGSSLGTCTINVSDVFSGGVSLYPCNFGTPVSLSPSTAYWIVQSGSHFGDAVSYQVDSYGSNSPGDGALYKGTVYGASWNSAGSNGQYYEVDITNGMATPTSGPYATTSTTTIIYTQDAGNLSFLLCVIITLLALMCTGFWVSTFTRSVKK